MNFAHIDKWIWQELQVVHSLMLQVRLQLSTQVCLKKLLKIHQQNVEKNRWGFTLAWYILFSIQLVKQAPKYPSVQTGSRQLC